MTSLVTGADGFVGRALRTQLASRGQDVRAATRATVGDIAAVTDWEPLVNGVDVVYHLAARVHVMNERSGDAAAAYRSTNVDATLALARASARAGVRHLVFVSSVKAGGEWSGSHPLRESDPPRPEDEYGRSKLEAERILEAVRAETSMHVSVLRPPLVYGAGVKANFLRLMMAVDRFVPLPLGSIRNERSLVYVGNLVDAMTRCVDGGEAASRTFYVSDGEDVSTADLVRKIAASLGRPALLVPVPVALLRTAGTLLGRRGGIDRLTSSLVVDGTAIRRALSWQPPFTLDRGLSETAAWYKRSR